MREITFDVDRIVKMVLTTEHESKRFVYQEPTTECYGFLWLKKREIAGGYLDKHDFPSYRIYDADGVRKLGYKVSDSKFVYVKAAVKVWLIDEHSIERTFSNDELARIWVENLKLKSKKITELVIYED